MVSVLDGVIDLVKWNFLQYRVQLRVFKITYHQLSNHV